MPTTILTRGRASRVLAGAAIAVLLTAATACGADSGDGTATPALPSQPLESSEILASDVEVLSDTERAGLLYMVEEEKLAHDVYVTLGALWDVPTFTNISRSETTHTDLVRSLLDQYDVPDPTEGMAVGEFSDPTFAALYDELVAQGRTSVTEALRVGAGIEELDIVDLEVRADQTDRADIDTVYARLLAGSENHLGAFVRALDARGVAYSPERLEQSVFDAVIAQAQGGRQAA